MLGPCCQLSLRFVFFRFKVFTIRNFAVRHSFAHFFSLAILTVIIGCNADYVRPGTMVEMEGEIYLDNAPIADAKIMFVPENVTLQDDFAISYGVTDTRGEFELRTGDGRLGALTGKHRVYISKATADANTRPVRIEPIDPTSDEKIDEVVAVKQLIDRSIDQPANEIIPYFYNLDSELTCEVVPGRGIHRVRFYLTSVDPLLLDSKKKEN